MTVDSRSKEAKLAYKNELKHFCHAILEERIAVAKAAMNAAQQSANSEEKSSAGDKYETGRAMSHLEKDMHSKQLSENIKELAMLHAIDTSVICTEAATGAFIDCGTVSFFIATGLGKQVVAGKTVLFLSSAAPLAALIKNKKVGDFFLFNRAETFIIDIY